MRSLFDAEPPAPERTGRKVLTVSELNAQVGELLDASLGALWVEGEISNLRRYPSGHTYFTLKDADAQVSAVLFRGASAWLRFRPEDGQKVLVHGRVGLYEARGSYQIVVDGMEPAGLGALQLALEQLKAKLQQEGLLDATRKRPLPALPQRIGIVTSPSGAALRDILRVLERRFANLSVVIAPARVQGAEAAEEIARGIEALNRLGTLDVLIVTRGGGSLEDLWAFNEEVVARAIAASRLPVISAVGHEIDVTLSDLVADLRAPTPSAAAEMVVVSKSELVDRIGSLRARLQSSGRLVIAERRDRLERLRAARALARVEARVREAAIRIDDSALRLRGRLLDSIRARRHRIAILAERMTPARLGERLQSRRQSLAERVARCGVAMAGAQRRSRDQVGAFAERLEALSPLAVLRRGYAICYGPDGGAILKDARQVQPGSAVRVRLDRGGLDCEVKEVIDGARHEEL